MAYLGGKAKGSDHIIKVLNDPQFDGCDYVEPFVGYGHILRRVENKRTYKASDNNPLLITLLKAVQKGTPLPHIKQTQYNTLKHQAGSSLRRAVAAFTYSYNGKEWGGYTDTYYRGGKKSYAQERKNYYATLHENPIFQRTRLGCVNYSKLNMHNKLVYCDPPYAGTTGYGGREFDNELFWNTMRKWSRNNTVLVSEYKAPNDFVCIASKKKHGTLSPTGRTVRNERLFVHKNIYHKIVKPRYRSPRTPGASTKRSSGRSSNARRRSGLASGRRKGLARGGWRSGATRSGRRSGATRSGRR